VREPLVLPAPPLLLVTDRKQACASLEDILAAAFAAGCRWASLREKDLPATEQIALAKTLKPLARAHGARLMLHGDPVLAKEAGVDGVHLSAGSNIAAARALLGPDALVGLSIHAGDDVAAFDTAPLDYLVAGPAYDTLSKPGYGPFLGPNGIAALMRVTKLPVVAIGGIEPGNAAALMLAGAAGIAVMGGVMRAADPSGEVGRLLRSIG
jgi:thiamine-phosphate pyrophosphorylase